MSGSPIQQGPTMRALDVAEAFDALPAHIQAHFEMLIAEHVASLHPTIARLYTSANRGEQQRWERIDPGKHWKPNRNA